MKYAKIYRVPLHLQFNLDISFISLDMILLFFKYIAAVPFTEHHVGLPYTTDKRKVLLQLGTLMF